MSKRFWRRLAGCIATSVALTAAGPEYRAGAARSDHVRAVAIEDRRDHRAVFVDADFPITREVADFVAVQLVKSYELARADIVISGGGSATPDTAGILLVLQEAMIRLTPATLTGGAAISVRTASGCVAIPLRASCVGGPPIHGTIRSAFQMVDLPHPLQTRDMAPQSYPVQAIAFGKTTLLALNGDAPTLEPNTAQPNEPRVRAALANVLRRVR
jgi:hypothetical protein